MWLTEGGFLETKEQNPFKLAKGKGISCHLLGSPYYRLKKRTGPTQKSVSPPQKNIKQAFGGRGGGRKCKEPGLRGGTKEKKKKRKDEETTGGEDKRAT